MVAEGESPSTTVSISYLLAKWDKRISKKTKTNNNNMKSIIQKLAFFSWAQIHFNPCSREGSNEIKLLDGSDAPISIHAPVKGAT